MGVYCKLHRAHNTHYGNCPACNAMRAFRLLKGWSGLRMLSARVIESGKGDRGIWNVSRYQDKLGLRTRSG